MHQVKVTAKLLNCRLHPSMSAEILGTIQMGEICNIIVEQQGWGQLENGSWIKLSFTVPYIRENTQEELKKEPLILQSLEKEYPLHEVKNKESLWDIAEHWYGAGQGSRYVEIKEFNHLKSDILYTGMILKIPDINV